MTSITASPTPTYVLHLFFLYSTNVLWDFFSKKIYQNSKPSNFDEFCNMLFLPVMTEPLEASNFDCISRLTFSRMLQNSESIRTAEQREHKNSQI